MKHATNTVEQSGGGLDNGMKKPKYAKKKKKFKSIFDNNYIEAFKTIRIPQPAAQLQ